MPYVKMNRLFAEDLSYLSLYISHIYFKGSLKTICIDIYKCIVANKKKISEYLSNGLSQFTAKR